MSIQNYEKTPSNWPKTLFTLQHLWIVNQVTVIDVQYIADALQTNSVRGLSRTIQRIDEQRIK